MTELTPSSTGNLDHMLTRLFDEEEFHILCLDLGVDYDELRGEDKAAKARELVSLAKGQGRLTELESAARRERPTNYSHQHLQALRSTILSTSQPNVREAFVEFVQQVEAYLNEFNLLQGHLAEWENVRNLLQDLQIGFAPCRNYVLSLGELAGSAHATQQRERILYEVEVEWLPCKPILRDLQELASNVQVIGQSYDPESDTGPDWSRTPWKIKAKIDQALFDDDTVALAEHLSAFGDQVDRSLYLADKALRNVVDKISRLPCPAVYAVR
ncbi:MAG: hypothetical protein GY832_07175 [Chloroflexi bacterium]|nr:hypothetical protein [Chloroflexota bacterium]